MTKAFAVGATIAGFSLVAIAAASAQTATTSTAPSAPVPTVDWPYGKLMADPAAKAVLARDLPGIVGYEHQNRLRGMTIRQIAHYPQSGIDSAKLDAVQADLAAAATTTTTAAATSMARPPQ